MLTATTGWKVAAVKYQWLHNGSAIGGETRKTFTPDVVVTGSSVRCSVSVTYTPMFTQVGACRSPDATDLPRD